MAEFAIILLLVGAIVVLAAPWIMRKRAAGNDWLTGTMLVTGVSPRPDADGEQFVTITGVINGPNVNEYTVYQRMALDVDAWPKMGQLFTVVYSPGNPEKWAFAPQDTPPPEQVP
ncbi:MAG: hypothetical protein K0U76_09105 [Actinomycetia bacterium]|nr:hypothetical protein [Actinomycetes bacterium]MCH9701533.1 hypothetical protein [Actinomycetes bacterium]MCH9761733.1 hypothetical protein [Actinomycetes bacterium]